MAYGTELILDLHDCNPRTFTRQSIQSFLRQLCTQIGMKREDLHFWDYKQHPRLAAKAPPHLKGTSAVQFIATSTIVIHTLENMRKVFVNIFSCNEFDAGTAAGLTEDWFDGNITTYQVVTRK
jgi:S-adenosylmethionine/arginine decarboxylase-like enzyme